ncbi:hypothetical protein PM082_014550 [Marasmius tenuissimus]|nr:hypothetical protein PM082_014550 [Marasmius tenuissimus]
MTWNDRGLVLAATLGHKISRRLTTRRTASQAWHMYFAWSSKVTHSSLQLTMRLSNTLVKEVAVPMTRAMRARNSNAALISLYFGGLRSIGHEQGIRIAPCSCSRRPSKGLTE